MNKNSLLAVALIAEVCTGTGHGVASVPDGQTHNLHEGRDTKIPSIAGTPKDRIRG